MTITVIAANEWVLVGQTSKESMLVRGGNKPCCIKVSHGDSSDLIALLEDANNGIQSGELHKAYLRIRKMLGNGAFKTPHAPTPEQVYLVTEDALQDLINKYPTDKRPKNSC